MQRLLFITALSGKPPADLPELDSPARLNSPSIALEIIDPPSSLRGPLAEAVHAVLQMLPDETIVHHHVVRKDGMARVWVAPDVDIESVKEAILDLFHEKHGFIVNAHIESAQPFALQEQIDSCGFDRFATTVA